jgi:hypothetical protein
VHIVDFFYGIGSEFGHIARGCLFTLLGVRPMGVSRCPSLSPHNWRRNDERSGDGNGVQHNWRRNDERSGDGNGMQHGEHVGRQYSSAARP